MHRHLVVLALLATGLLAPAAAGTIDAVTGASISVTGGTTTASSATIRWTETERNGVLRFYWDTTNTVRTKMRDSLAVTTSRGGGSWTIPTAYKAGKIYHYAFQGIYPNASLASNAKSNYAITGTFTMDAGTGILHFRNSQGRLVSNPYDAMGRARTTNAAGIRLGSDGATPSLKELQPRK